MNARDFLIRGLLAGLLAGLATFAVAYVVGEPHVDTAIAIEEAGHHTHGEDAGFSRQDQSTWGLATGTVTVGVTFGGVLALVAAAAMGRIGNLSASASTALVGAVSYVSVVLIPFLKYPATPPAVGDGETIGQRTVLYFTFVAVSLIAAVLCTAMATRLLPRLGIQGAMLTGAGTYLAVVTGVGALMPAVNEIDDFPGDVLWDFRLASIITLTALWATIGIALTALVGRLEDQHLAVRRRREFAASL